MSDVMRPNGISYLRVPAPDPGRSAAFYEAVFGWTVEPRADGAAFQDGTGHVIGHLVRNEAVVGPAGIRPYVYVEDLDATLERVVGHGGDLVEPPYPEGDLRVATFHDPAGNVVGAWERST